MSKNVTKTLEERGADYGSFADFATVCQSLTDVVRSSKGYREFMDPVQREALEMVVHKIARMLSGNPDLVDTWRDAAAYATLGMNHTLNKSGAVDVEIVRQPVANRGKQ